MKIAVTGGKGGTGKSMLATTIATMLSKNSRTMLVDADVECPNDHLLLSARLKNKKPILQTIPKWDFKKCNNCGKCAVVCKQEAIVFVKGKKPAFIKDACIGCCACILACQNKAISKSKKTIGWIKTGKKNDLIIVSGELKLGELASGEVVSEVRKYSEELHKKEAPKNTIIDSAAGIGCPVIASIAGTDYVVAVTEPTPSALHDLKRALFLANHFRIPAGIVINKYDLEKNYCKKIEAFSKKARIQLMGKIPYSQDFVDSTIKMRPITETKPKYKKVFAGIIQKLLGGKQA